VFELIVNYNKAAKFTSANDRDSGRDGRKKTATAVSGNNILLILPAINGRPQYLILSNILPFMH